MELDDIVPRSQELVKQLPEGMNLGELTLEQAEEKVLGLLYELGRELEQLAVGGLKEPTKENTVVVGHAWCCMLANGPCASEIGLAARPCCLVVVTGIAMVVAGGVRWIRNWGWIAVSSRALVSEKRGGIPEVL